MRLASKIFLTSSLVILVLAGVGALSLGAVGRLVSVNREITTQTVPALRVSSGLRDQMLSLARLEARYSVLKDARYATAWRARGWASWHLTARSERSASPRQPSPRPSARASTRSASWSRRESPG